MGGIMDLTGQPDGEPMRGGVAFADVMTGIYSADGDLRGAERAQPHRQGSYIDMALLDTQVAVLANQAASYLVSGTAPKRWATRIRPVVPYQVFPRSPTATPIIACGNDSQFARLIALLGAPEMAQDERYHTNAGRVVNRGTLIPRMFEMTAKISRADLLAKLEAAGVPGGPINTLEDVFRRSRRCWRARCASTCQASSPRAARSRACARRSPSTACA
jgi:crotonobetainyl-CoA:carnitine CoA-transferase CaiB-like acyl-CoA transferase